MKAASAPLIALLASGKQFVMWDLYTVTLIGGAQATLDSRVNVIKRGATRLALGLETSTLQVSIACSADTLIDGVPLAPFAHQGGFDGARLALQRAFAAEHGVAAVGTLDIFAGRIGEPEVSGTELKLPVHSDVELFDIMMPRNLYMSGCGHTVYDDGCGLSRAANTVATTVASGSTTLLINTALGAIAADRYALGVVRFTSGALEGVRRTIRSSTTGGALVPMLGLPVAPTAGDGIEVTLGCDRQFTTCGTRFNVNNQDNWRGFEFIPVPEVSY